MNRFDHQDRVTSFENDFRTAIDRRLDALQSSPARRACIRQAVIKEEGRMKRKMHIGAAIALSLTLALAGIAAAAGLDLFRFFADEQGFLPETLTAIAPLSAPQESTQAILATGPDSAAVGAIENIYYDGHFLVLAHSLRDPYAFASAGTPSMLPEGAMPLSDIDDRFRQAAYEKWEALLSRVSAESRDAMQDFAAAVDSARPACLAYTVVSVDPRISLAGLDPYYFGMGGHSAETLDDGTEVTIDILPYPLIKDARGLDALDIAIGLNTYTRYLYFDGSLFYDLSGEKAENAAQMTATIARSDVEKRCYAGQADWMGSKIEAEALISGALGAITLQADEDVFESEPLGGTWRMLVLDEDGNVLEQASMFPVDQTSVARARNLSHVIAVGQHLPEKIYVYPYYAAQELPAQQVQETCEPIELTLQN